jgi:hypothetical protein
MLGKGLKGWQRYFEFMREEEKDGQTCTLQIGDKVRLVKDIWDDGADHHPARLIASAGENVFVDYIEINNTSLLVHSDIDSRILFTVYLGEYIVL